MKKLSIIIPIYNLENYIGDTLKSCISQNIDLSEYEIICINDGSQDQSEEIVRRYQQQYSNIILYTQENSGVSSARNKGIELAKGRYLWFVDGDDTIAYNCLSSMLKVIEENDVDIFGFHLQSVSSRKISSAQVEEYEFSRNPNEIMSFMTNFGGCGVCNEIFKTKIVKDNEIFFHTNIKYSEDVLFSYRVLQKCSSCAKTHTTLYYYYQREGSAMHSSNHLKHVESMYLLAGEYLKIADEEEKWRDMSLSKKDSAIKALLFGLVQNADVKLAKEWIVKLRSEKFYPFPFLWESLRNNATRKQALINYLSFLFPCKWYFMTCVRLVALKNKFRRKSK